LTMWPFDLFRKRVMARPKSTPLHLEPHRLHARIEKLEAEKKILHLLLHEHHNTLVEHTRLLENHTQTLDDLVDSPAFSRPKQPASEPQEAMEFVPKLTLKRPDVLPKSDKLQVIPIPPRAKDINSFFPASGHGDVLRRHRRLSKQIVQYHQKSDAVAGNESGFICQDNR